MRGLILQELSGRLYREKIDAYRRGLHYLPITRPSSVQAAHQITERRTRARTATRSGGGR